MGFQVSAFTYRQSEVAIFLDPDRTYSVQVGDETSSHWGTIPYARRAGEVMVNTTLKTERRKSKWLKFYAEKSR